MHHHTDFGCLKNQVEKHRVRGKNTNTIIIYQPRNLQPRIKKLSTLLSLTSDQQDRLSTLLADTKDSTHDGPALCAGTPTDDPALPVCLPGPSETHFFRTGGFFVGNRVPKATPTAPTVRFCIAQVRTRVGSTFRDVCAHV